MTSAPQNAFPALIKPLIRRIKRRHRHIKHPQPADRPMPAAGLDEDRVAGPHGMPLAVELHLAFAFEDVIDFGQPLVVVRPRVGRDIDDVQRRDAVRVIDKRPPRLAARALDRRQFGEAARYGNAFDI